MNVGEVMAILKDCDPTQNIYIHDLDGTAQIVTAIGDLQHIGDEDLGVSIPDDLYMMTTAQFDKFVLAREEEDD